MSDNIESESLFSHSYFPQSSTVNNLITVTILPDISICIL